MGFSENVGTLPPPHQPVVFLHNLEGALAWHCMDPPIWSFLAHLKRKNCSIIVTCIIPFDAKGFEAWEGGEIKGTGHP